jgi:hypothetical protein
MRRCVVLLQVSRTGSNLIDVGTQSRMMVFEFDYHDRAARQYDQVWTAPAFPREFVLEDQIRITVDVIQLVSKHLETAMPARFCESAAASSIQSSWC